MKTQPLSERFPGIYQNFMINKQRVISIPVLQSRTGHLDTNQEGIHILEAIDSRIYIAYKKTKIEDTNLCIRDSKKQKRKKKTRGNSQIHLLIENESENQENLYTFAEKISNIINTQENIDDISAFLRQHTTQFTPVQQLRLQEEISGAIIYKNAYETRKIPLVIDKKQEQDRLQIEYKQSTKSDKIAHDEFTFLKQRRYTTAPKILNNQQPGIYKNATKLTDIEKTKNEYLSLLVLHSITNGALTPIQYLSNETPTLQKLPNNSQIIRHSAHQASLLLPKELDISHNQEVLQYIIESNPDRTIYEQTRKIFSPQPGIKREVNHAGGIISYSLRGRTFLLKNNHGEVIAGDKEELLANKKFDIIIDTTTNKLYLNGKKTSTSDIHTQTMTNEVLLRLLHKQSNTIHNDILSPSSYSKNKNNMLSKVILPLQKAVKKHCKKEIKIHCTGQLNEFIIKKDPDTVHIGRITTIFGEKTKISKN